MPVALPDSQRDTRSTRSGISDGQITITDQAGQAALTRNQSIEYIIAGLNREVETGRDTSGSLSNNLDENEINAKFAIASTFVKETATYISNRGKEVDRAKKALDTEKEKTADERDDALVAQLEQQYKNALIENETWLPGGTGRKVVNALNAAVGGNLSAGATQFVQMGVANYLQQEGASLLGEWTREGKLTEGSPLHAALHGAVGCLGAAAGGGDCGAGGMGAATSSLLTNLFTAQPDETVADKEAKRDIIVGLTTAMALGTNLDPGTAMNSAVSAVDNNYLTSAQVVQKRKELEACQSLFCRFRVESKWTGVDIGQEVSFDAGVVAGVPAGLHDTIDGVVKMLGNPGETYEALRLLLNSDDLLGNVSDAVKQSFRDRLDKMDEEYLKGGAEGAFNSGMETGKLFMDIAGLLTGAGGAVKTTAMATEKVIARVVALKGAGRSVVDRGLDQAGDAAKAGDDLVELGRDTDLPEHRDSTAGRETGQDSHTHDDIATSTNEPRTNDNASSVGQNEASNHSGVGGSVANPKGPMQLEFRDTVQLDEFNRLNQVDAAVGKLKPGEASAAVEIQNAFGGQLRRANASDGDIDFVFADGPNQGKTVDFMFTVNTQKQQAYMNKFFNNNFDKNVQQLNSHVQKADIVPLDFRNLETQNQTRLMEVINNMPSEQSSKIVIMR